MFFLVAILIMLSVYVAKNEKIAEKSRVCYFVVVGIIFALILLFSFLSK